MPSVRLPPHLSLLLALVACADDTPPTSVETTRTLLLARHAEHITDVTLPDASRSLPLSASVPIHGPWQADWRTDALVQWSIPLPVRGIDFGFGRSRAPEGVKLMDPAGRKRRWAYTREQEEARPWTWDVSRQRIRVRLPAGATPPEDWTLKVPPLQQLEAALQHTLAGDTPADFVARTVLVDEQSHHGLFLPAPAHITFALPSDSLGTHSRLRTTVRVLAPFLEGPDAGDGATVSIQLTQGGTSTEIWTGHVVHGEPVKLDIPVPAGGTPARLTLATAAGPSGDATVDYVFFDEPTLLSPTPRPRRVLLVLIDTLRADRLGAFGYERPTSPAIDALAMRGTRFHNAHAPSPWTLPSTRALLSGKAPEAWTPLDHLGSRLAGQGFATALISGNTYISRYVDMHRGWTLHAYRLFSGADRQLDQMEAFLGRHTNQDALVVLQLMEPHLPYREPEHLRELWAGPTPTGMRDSFSVKDVRRWDKKGVVDADARQWVSDRYDQNVRAADEAVARAVELMGEDALVIVTSDHGEELWDHGDFEHGHALWEELVRVPLVMAGPGIPKGHIDAPVSLRDVAPTMLGMLGMDAADTTGMDLRPAMHQDQSALDALTKRPLAFRDLLYRSDAVAVLVEGRHKWSAREGTQQVFDLAADPSEKAPLDIDPTPFHAALSTALQRQVVDGWRVALPGAGEVGGGRRARLRADISLTHPDGLTAAFSAFDSRQRTASLAAPIDGGFQLKRVPEKSFSAEIFVVPGEPRTDPSAPTLTVQMGARVWTDPPSSEELGPHELRRTGPPSATVVITPAVFAMPSTAGTGQVEIDSEARAGLEALGYLE